jgi:hypothetical protein
MFGILHAGKGGNLFKKSIAKKSWAAKRNVKKIEKNAKKGAIFAFKLIFCAVFCVFSYCTERACAAQCDCQLPPTKDKITVWLEAQMKVFDVPLQFKLYFNRVVILLESGRDVAFEAIEGKRITRKIVENALEEAGSNFEQVTSLFIPLRVTSIYEKAFKDCSNLEHVIFEEHSRFGMIDRNTFLNCSSLRSIVIPASVQYIGSGAFGNCSALTSVIFEERSHVKVIEDWTFFGCTALKDIHLPQRLEHIGARAFEKAGQGLLVIPATVWSMGWKAFEGSGFSIIIFEEGSAVTNIYDSAFANCKNLIEVRLPRGLRRIDFKAFCQAGAGISGQKPFIIPGNVSFIGESAFADSKFPSIIFEDGSKVKEIYQGAFTNCINLEGL